MRSFVERSTRLNCCESRATFRLINKLMGDIFQLHRNIFTCDNYDLKSADPSTKGTPYYSVCFKTYTLA